MTLAMPKSLGMIHTVNYELGDTGLIGIAAAQSYLIDLPGQLTQQLQRMVRAGSYFKVVGIDMSMRNIAGTLPVDPIVCAGVIQYYAPTVGRCNALRAAFKAVKAGMKLQGINVQGNRQYDFRVPMENPPNFINGADFLNQATIDGSNVLTLDASAPGGATDQVFGVWNSNIQPTQTAGVNFSVGFGLPGMPGLANTDYVLNEGEFYEASLVHSASDIKEEIPFSLSFGMDSVTNTATAVTLEWRPDPALYLAILTGQLGIDIISMGGPQADYRIDLAVHVSGWKSVLGSGKKRRSKKGKSHGRKRRSKK